MEKAMAKNLMEEYTKFISTSEMIIEYYKNQTTTGLEKYFLAIEDWMEKEVPPEENKPLVILAHEGVGKKTLLAQWMKYHQQKSKKAFPDQIIPHFSGTGGNNANHYYAIYKILIRLREQFNIAQKVEVLEKKLVHFFRYWLELASRALVGKIVDDSTIILVFDSINMFVDPYTGEEANIALWLPQVFPERIKVIITTEPGTAAHRHLESIGCQVIQIDDEPLVLTSIINNQLSRPSFINDDIYKQKVIEILNSKSQEVLRLSLFVKTYLSTLLPYPSDNIVKESEVNKEEFIKIFKKIDFEKLKAINGIEELNIFMLEYFSENIMEPAKFKLLITALTITDKGLTEQELFDLAKVSEREWKHLLAVFKNFFMTYKELWKITNEPFKKAVYKHYLKDNAYLVKLHEEISEVLKKTPTSIRKLEEQSFHLTGCKSFFRLKEVVANIENFLLLFNPNNKFELCRYWQILEQKGFDPSVEYSNSIEGFEIHYKPSSEDTFMIILQVSRFLKEFGDFETDLTPEYRHPPIKGGIEIKDIGLRREIKKMGMFVAESWEEDDDKIDDIEELEHELSKEFPDYTEAQMAELVKQIYESTLKKRQEDQLKLTAEAEANGTQKTLLEGSAQNNTTMTSEASKEKGDKKAKKRVPAILNDIESLNVDIPENRERFKNFFLGQSTKKAAVQGDAEQKEKYLDEQEGQPSQQQKAFETDISAANRSVRVNFAPGSKIALDDVKKEHSSLQEIKHEHEHQNGHAHQAVTLVDDKPSTYYYYKRWLWMMFPWVTISFKMNYSRIIYECYSSATKYISVPEEREKTRQALKIAIEAKLKKQLILLSKDPNASSTMKSTNKMEHSATQQRKILPPLQKSYAASHSKIGNFSSTNKSLGLTNSNSPYKPQATESQSAKNTSKKKPHQFFVTHEFLNVSNFNSSLNLNISKIDSVNEGDNTTIDPVFNTSLLNKTKGKAAIQEKSLFASEKKFEMSLQKSSENIKTLLLPGYQDSVIGYSAKQVEDLEAKVQTLNVTLNDIVYKTKIQARKLKEAAIIEDNLSRSGAVDFSEKFETKQKEVGESIEKAEITKADVVKQKDRLESIINICLKNKKEDELYIRSLNHLLNNFKKLIQWETQIAAAETQKAIEMERLAKKYAEAQDEKIQTMEVMIKHIRNEKILTNKVDRKVGQAYANLEGTALQTVDKLKTTMKAQNEKREMEKNRSMVQKNKNAASGEQFAEMRDFMARVEKTLGTDSDDPKSQMFNDYVEKILDYEAGIYEVKRDIAKLEEEKARQASHLDTLKKARDFQKNQSQVLENNSMVPATKTDLQNALQDKRRKAEELSRTIMSQTKNILDAQMILAKICNDLDIKTDSNHIDAKTIPTEQICEKVQEKLKTIEEKIEPAELEKMKLQGFESAVYQSEAREGLQTEGDMSPSKRDNLLIFKQGKRYLEVVTK